MISEDVKELVIAKLSVMPSDRKLAVGAFGEFTKEQLIKHVEDDDDVGRKIAEIEISFLKAVAQGKVYG